MNCLTPDTLLADPAVMDTILAAGFSHKVALRWLHIAFRYDIRTLGEYLNIPDDELMAHSNFGARCLGVTQTLRLSCDIKCDISH